MEPAEKQLFIYVTAVPCNGPDGQNRFEFEVTKALAKANGKYRGISVMGFCARLDDSSELPPGDSTIRYLPLRSKTYGSYLQFQWRLLKSLGWCLWKHRRSEIAVFMRYHPSMVAPLVLQFIFRFTLLMRTGPVLPNLFIYGKNPRPLVYHGIRITLGQFCRRAAKIVTVTQRIKQWVVDTYSVLPDRVVIVPNAVAPEEFHAERIDRRKWNLPEDAVVAGFVGSVCEDQGLETVLQALALLQDNGRELPHLLVVGDGPDFAKLTVLAHHLGIEERVHWSGRVDHTCVSSAIYACDAMLAPFTKRAFGTTGSSALKLWEYLACDKPVIASRDEDHLFIENEGLGALVEPENVPAWAEALSRAGGWSEGLGGRGRRLVLDRHTYDAVAKKFIDLGLPACSQPASA